MKRRRSSRPPSTDKKFESHFRVLPHVLSTGFNASIPLGWAQRRLPPPPAAASERQPARSEPLGQTERTHFALIRGSPPVITSGSDRGPDELPLLQADRCKGRGGRRKLEMQQDETDDRPPGDGGADLVETL
jgi:hypothetical protein